jgi:hypothetical protein
VSRQTESWAGQRTPPMELPVLILFVCAFTLSWRKRADSSRARWMNRACCSLSMSCARIMLSGTAKRKRGVWAQLDRTDRAKHNLIYVEQNSCVNSTGWTHFPRKMHVASLGNVATLARTRWSTPCFKHQKSSMDHTSTPETSDWFEGSVRLMLSGPGSSDPGPGCGPFSPPLSDMNPKIESNSNFV